MTNFEKLVELGKTDMGKFAKKIADTFHSCKNCPIKSFCGWSYRGCENSWQKWLESEVEE